MRKSALDSPKSAMPTMAVPAAPMPVHTAYAVPTGIVFSACARQAKLAIIAAMVMTLGQRREKPCVYFKPIAHPISNTPAMNK